ncbi:MAG: hypothetical protein M1826_007761 [Phylliscum demangeonii]|nr:MAG: hypothetical protein M1826_007761 [Phylliscum demangeonii]
MAQSLQSMAMATRPQTRQLALFLRSAPRSPWSPLRRALASTRPIGPIVDRDHIDIERSQAKGPATATAVLTDRFRRQHDYLRISITERCNLRCLYCMPPDGVQLSPPSHLLTSAEIYLLSSLFVRQGVKKIRLTGGEPTVRKDIVALMRAIGALRPLGLQELCLTTNGLALLPKLDHMLDAGLTAVNLSLDTLDPLQFQLLTRRNGLDRVLRTMDGILERKARGARLTLKINCVVMRAVNEREIIPFVEMARDKDLEVRFIEYMPFAGNQWHRQKMVSYHDMLDLVRSQFPTIAPVPGPPNETGKTYHIPGFQGRVGFVTSMTDHFCASCNRLRITADGNLKVCLFGNAEVSLRDRLRERTAGAPPLEDVTRPLSDIHLDPATEEELLALIGMAVQGKQARHAGMEILAGAKNRPMVMIGGDARSHWLSLHHGPVGRRRARAAPWTMIPPALLDMAGRSGLDRRSFASSCVRRSDEEEPGPAPGLLPGTQVASTTPNEEEPNPAPGPLPVTQVASTPTEEEAGPAPGPSPVTHVASTPTEEEPGPAPRSVPVRQVVSRSNARKVVSRSNARMVSIASKAITARTAVAVGHVFFSNIAPLSLIKANGIQKGDVLAVARIAGIMAAKRTADLIPLCHPLPLTSVVVKVALDFPDAKAPAFPLVTHRFGSIRIQAQAECDGKTGAEMEALMAVMGAALTVVDMCKGVDRGMSVDGVRVVAKSGGRSGDWTSEG